MSKQVKIEDYSPVDKTTTCKNCGSTTVTWHQRKDGSWVLSEIFILGDEDVYSLSDIHMRYCDKPVKPWRVKEEDSDPIIRKAKRQAQITEAEENFMKDEDERVEDLAYADPEPTDAPTGQYAFPGEGEGHHFALNIPFRDISLEIEIAAEQVKEEGDNGYAANKLQTLYWRLYHEIPK